MEYKEKKVNNIKKYKTRKNKKFTGIKRHSKYSKRNVIKRKSIKRKSIKRKSIKRKSIKHKGIKHKGIKKSYKKYMKGGGTSFHPQSPPPEVKFTDYHAPLPGNPFATINGLQNAAMEQNDATRQLTGGGKYRKKSQSGGNIELCSNSLVNNADGFGYVPPVGCIPVPTLSNPNAQELAISNVHISAVGQENAKYDNFV